MSLAVVGLAADGSADYGFHVLGAADWQWTDDELAAVLPDADGDPARRVDLELDGARAARPSRGWSSGSPPTGSALISVDPNIRPMLADGPVGASLGNTARDRPRAAGPAGRPRRHRQGQRRGPRLARARARRPPTPSTPTARAWAERGPGAGARHRRRRPAADRPAGPRRPALADAAGDRRRHRRRRRLTGRRPARRAAGVRRHRPGRAGGAARRATCCAWWTTPPWSPPSTARGSGADPPTRAEFAAARARAMTAPDDVRLVGFAELSATAVRGAAARRARPVLGHRHPRRCTTRVWFHQFGGFGALARTAGGEDVGYVLGRRDRRPAGLPAPARRAGRPAPVGARPPAVPLVRRPGAGARARASSRRSPGRTNAAALAFHTALGASAHLSPRPRRAGRGPRGPDPVAAAA